MTPEPFGDGQAYVARADLLPLVFLTQNAGTPSEPELGGRCLRWVARGRYPVWATGISVPIQVRVA
jgi:hypothetical protein